ncbi:PH domain-containing protein [Nocardioides campestrisoli]|uniref:PH domain-containing protein n=1 Tax=Nocardioides campestrisoli TaxID=2736757 RepID=UPI001C626D1D|nr:PH domain-containing protein [Nocardioides campestrisoli]
MSLEPSDPAAVPPPSSEVLRDPAHRVCPRAVGYWRTKALLGALAEIAAAGVLFLVLPEWPWWATVLVAVLVVANGVYTFVVPGLRYRVHRWEVTPQAVYTRSGWLSLETRIAPLNRVQTVESHQGALMRRYRLASLTVTTASAAGPITIEGLDAEEARTLVAQLTAITGASEGDAT